MCGGVSVRSRPTKVFHLTSQLRAKKLMTAPSSVVSPQVSRNQRTAYNEGVCEVEMLSELDFPMLCCAIEVFPYTLLCLLFSSKRLGLRSTLQHVQEEHRTEQKVFSLLDPLCLTGALSDYRFIVTPLAYLLFLEPG